MKIDPVRDAALGILIRHEKGAALDPLLDAALADMRRRDPAAPGAAFLAELVRGTLQWRGRYDHILNRYSRQGLPTDPKLLSLLRLALHQLLAMDKIPAYAAVDQSVSLCRRRVSPKTAGYVNGLLQAVRRRLLIAADGCPDERRLIELFADLADDPAAWLAAWYSFPGWLVERWLAAFGRERTEAILTAGNAPVRLCFNVLDPAETNVTGERLAAGDCPVEPGRRPGSLLAVGGCRRERLRRLLAELPGVIVQDQNIAEATDWLLAPASTAPAGLPVVDLCAAPGGKTAVLAFRWPAGAEIIALDNQPERIRLLSETVERTGPARVSVLTGDGLAPPVEPGACAAVLLDGPCSGTGVLRHHPDGRWRLQPDTPVRNGRRLLDLARSATELLAPGGLLMYATCSLEADENEDVLTALLADRTDLEPVPDDDGAWQRRWWPDPAVGDGFFAARLRKTGRE